MKCTRAHKIAPLMLRFLVLVVVGEHLELGSQHGTAHGPAFNGNAFLHVHLGRRAFLHSSAWLAAPGLDGGKGWERTFLRLFTMPRIDLPTAWHTMSHYDLARVDHILKGLGSNWIGLRGRQASQKDPSDCKHASQIHSFMQYMAIH